MNKNIILQVEWGVYTLTNNDTYILYILICLVYSGMNLTNKLYKIIRIII